MRRNSAQPISEHSCSHAHFSINGRYMRTRIAQDTTSPTFNESFWVEIDRSSAATQELSMTVWHHSAHGEALGVVCT